MAAADADTSRESLKVQVFSVRQAVRGFYKITSIHGFGYMMEKVQDQVSL